MINIWIQEIKFWIRIIKTALHVKGYEWYSPYVKRFMETEGRDGTDAD